MTRGLWEAPRVDGDRVVVQVCEQMGARDLALELTGSKRVTARLFERGQLSRADVVLAQTDVLAPGDEVCLGLWCEPLHEAAPDLRRPVVVFQDRLLMAVDKPAGLLVHGDGTGTETLTARVQAELARQGSAAAAQAVQRLDVGTTGLVVFSLAEEFQPMLDAQMAGHDMRKRYLAVVEGMLPGTGDTWRELAWPIGRDRHDARRMRVSAGGKPSLTRARTLGERNGRSLVLVELATGRRHQIRVHLAHAGHPIVGDVLYGGRPCGEGLMLHAWQERLLHPLTRESLELETAWPERFSRLGWNSLLSGWNH